MTEEPLELARPSNAVLRDARQLLRLKRRQGAGVFLADGPQVVREALKVDGLVESLFVRWDSARDQAELILAAKAAGVLVYGVSKQNMAMLSDTVSPQGVMALVRKVDVPLADVVGGKTGDRADDLRPQPKLIVVCAQIRDPGNAGTVIRCADAFGADAVIFTGDSVELYNPKTVRASVGSLFHLPVVIGAVLEDVIARCRAHGIQVFATDAHGTDLTKLGDLLTKPTAWIMGNEAWGLPSDSLALADQIVAVPIYGKAESLNLATAAAVCLYVSATAQHASTE